MDRPKAGRATAATIDRSYTLSYASDRIRNCTLYVPAANTGKIYLGPREVSSTSGLTLGAELSANDTYYLGDDTDLATWWIAATVAGEGVTWLGWWP